VTVSISGFNPISSPQPNRTAMANRNSTSLTRTSRFRCLPGYTNLNRRYFYIRKLFFWLSHALHLRRVSIRAKHPVLNWECRCTHMHIMMSDDLSLICLITPFLQGNASGGITLCKIVQVKETRTTALISKEPFNVIRSDLLVRWSMVAIPRSRSFFVKAILDDPSGHWPISHPRTVVRKFAIVSPERAFGRASC